MRLRIETSDNREKRESMRTQTNDEATQRSGNGRVNAITPDSKLYIVLHLRGVSMMPNIVHRGLKYS
jgi:hypothetical protein